MLGIVSRGYPNDLRGYLRLLYYCTEPAPGQRGWRENRPRKDNGTATKRRTCHKGYTYPSGECDIIIR